MRLTITDGERQVSIRALRGKRAAELSAALLAAMKGDADDEVESTSFGFVAGEQGEG
ncbi:MULTISPECIES: hypothetical protein [unclassified Streptomyces]|uniref:hypothetical protein n=1 Tax=unclassified Streptomyces TaxID=2593676 RepID=UPI0035DD8A61